MLNLNPKELASIKKPSGEVFGPYKAKFAGNTIIIADQMANVEVGDYVIRQLPNGNEELNLVTQCDFFDTSIPGFGPHFQIKFKKGNLPVHDKTVQNINIHSTGPVQVGNHNTQNIIDSFNDLAQKIESSTATNSEKQEAKSLLSKLTNNPLVVSIIGAAAGSVFK